MTNDLSYLETEYTDIEISHACGHTVSKKHLEGTETADRMKQHVEATLCRMCSFREAKAAGVL